MQRERRLTKGETPEAPTKKLSTIVPQDASPDTAEASQWPAETAPKPLMMPSGYASGAGLPPMWGN